MVSSGRIPVRVWLAILGLALVATIAGYRLAPFGRSLLRATPEVEWAKERDRLESQRQEILNRDVPAIALDHAPETTDRLLSAMQARTGVHEAGVPQEAVDALHRRVLSHLRARASDDPEAYLRLAEEESRMLRWIAPESRQWEKIRAQPAALFEMTGGPLRDGDAGAELTRFLRVYIDHWSGPWTHVGVGDWGMRIDVEQIRAAGAAGARHHMQSQRELEYWLGAPSKASYVFREPARSIDDVLRRHRMTYFAQTRIVVHAEHVEPFVWHASWLWDPDERDWVCMHPGVRGWKAPPLPF